MSNRIYTPRDPDDLAYLVSLEEKYGPVQYRPRSGFKLSHGMLYVKESQARGGHGIAHGNTKGRQRQCPWCSSVQTGYGAFRHYNCPTVVVAGDKPVNG